MVARVRRAFKTRRVGHTGTLDPFASGLLLLCINNATRIAEYITPMRKTYEAELVFGAATDTDDRTGTVTATSDAWRALDAAAIANAFAAWQGERVQLPSQFSAKKVDGQRAYDAARRGVAVELQPVAVTIYDLTVLDVVLPLVRFRVTCSSGTYVRALARDIGAELGVFAHLTTLRRTAIGAHAVDGAVTPELLDDEAAVDAAKIGVLTAISHLRRVDITDEDVAHISHGRQIPMHRDEPGVITLHCDDRVSFDRSIADELALVHDGELVAIGERHGSMIQPRKVLLHG